MVITSYLTGLHLIEKLEREDEQWSSMYVLSLSAHCNCGEGGMNFSWGELKYFMKTHCAAGHKIKLDILLRFRAEVCPMRECDSGPEEIRDADAPWIVSH